jgi:DNA polymerase-3 subunit delta
VIYAIAGNNNYLIRKASSTLIDDFLKDNQEHNLIKFDCSETSFEQIIGSISNVSLFGEKQLVVLVSPQQNDDLVEGLDLLIGKSDNSDVLIIYDSVDKRSKLYKTLKKESQFQEFFVDEKADISGWIVDEVKNRGGEISKSSAMYLAGQVGNDQIRLVNEIEKLVSFDVSVTNESIDLLCEPTPQSTVFQLIDAVFAGNYNLSSKLYSDQRAQNVEPILILGMLIWQIHILAIVHSGKSLSSGEIAKKAKLNPFVVGKATKVVSSMSRDYLRRILEAVTDLDLSLKTKPIDADQAIKNLLLKLSQNRV